MQAPRRAAKPPALTFAFTLRVQVGPPTEVGEMPAGRADHSDPRRHVRGAVQFAGTVLAGGADWQIVQGTA